MVMKAGIFGVGSCLPDKVVTNADLTRMVETSDEWISTRTGIKERRISSYETSTSDLAYGAAEKAIQSAGIDRNDIDLIIVGTSTPDMLFPSVGCILQDRLGATRAAAFDVSAACSGFNFALASASAFIETGQYKCVLLVGADTLTKYLDFSNRDTCVLFGDGAGAVVLKPTSDGSGVLYNYLCSEGSGGKYLTMPGGGSRDPELKNGNRYISMNGKEVFKFAVRALETSVRHILAANNLKIEDIDLLIPHQANVRIIDHVCAKLKISPEKVYVNLQKYGNTSAASIPIALDEALSNGKIKNGERVILAGFGAGLTYGANLVKWSI